MIISSYYPVLATADVPSTARYYEATFGFTPRFETDWYVHLGHPGHDFVALALVDKNHETMPPIGRVPAQGLLLNFEVEDVDAEFRRIAASGAEVVVPLRDEAFGQRHFIVRGPDGVLIDVITPIRPSAEYADSYLGDAH